uniref:Uncharacterized protein LOC114348702 n=1 Tax=Diabrotica virgifera virgifera TaxID=50390 RepID=A0A6P7H082_DIAVI
LLATGVSYKTSGHSFRLGFSTVATIVDETSEAIWRRLQPIYVPETTKEIWEKSILGFKNIWQFPNCLGYIDGKHVTIRCPQKSRSNHFSYLKNFSIVLMGIVGPDGFVVDGDIFETSDMGRIFANETMNMETMKPPNRPLAGENEEIPCVLIGDEAFTLSPYLMRPFPYRQARNDNSKERFNTFATNLFLGLSSQTDFGYT